MAMAMEQQGRSYPELQSLSAALACLSLLYILMPRLSRGLPRMLCLLPCLPVIMGVPFSVRSHALRGVFSFIFLWICPSKLLLRCWDITPDYPADGFLYFMATSLMPFRVKERTISSSKTFPARTFQGALLLPLFYFLCFLAILHVFWYSSNNSGWVNLAFDCLLGYLGMEGGLGLASALASSLLGCELHPFFDKPFLASSLSEFWGKRWNRLSSYMLRETVYTPTLHFLSVGSREHGTSLDVKMKTSANVGMLSCERDARRGVHETDTVTSGKEFRIPHTIPSSFARAMAMLATFIASGLIHELIFYCITQTSATWEVTAFFVLHGVATALEVYLGKKFSNRRKLPQPIPIVCTMAFIYFSAACLFLPPLTRSGAELRMLAEFSLMQDVVVDFLRRYKG